MDITTFILSALIGVLIVLYAYQIYHLKRY